MISSILNRVPLLLKSESTVTRHDDHGVLQLILDTYLVYQCTEITVYITADYETFAARENVRVIDHLLRHTNRKNAVPNLVNARSDTEQTAQEVDNSVSSAAKIRRNSENTKLFVWKMVEYRNISDKTIYLTSTNKDPGPHRQAGKE